jgi:type IV secretory pathway component VirB8
MPPRTRGSRRRPAKVGLVQQTAQRSTRSSTRAKTTHDATVKRNVAFLMRYVKYLEDNMSDDITESLKPRYEAWYWTKYANLLKSKNKTIFELPYGTEMTFPSEIVKKYGRDWPDDE